MKHGFGKYAAVLLAAVLCMTALIGCGKAVDGTKTAVTVNGEAVKAGVISFEAHYEQAMLFTYYGSYIGSTGYYDIVADEETGKTYGQDTIDQIAASVEEDVIISQHAADYGVALTEEETAKIDEVAQTFVTANEASALKKMGVTKEDIVYSLTIDTIRSKMLDPMAADVDTEVSDEEANQTSVSYISVNIATADSVEAEDGATDEEKEALAKTTNDETEKKLSSMLAEITAMEDPSAADFDALAEEAGDSYFSYTGHFTTSEEEVTSVSQEIADAVRGLEDGTVVDHIVVAEEEGHYFIVRLDKNFDEEATASQKETIIKTRKQENFNTLVAQWKEASEIVPDEEVLASLALTDSEAYVFKMEESE